MTTLTPGTGAEHVARWRTRVATRSLERATQRSLERGESFITAARGLMDASDGAGFTVQQVADAAGQSLRTFYQHFRSKDDLLLAVFEEAVIGATRDLRAAVDQHQDALSRLGALVVGAAAVGYRRGDTVSLSQHHLALAESHPEELAVVQRPMVALVQEVLAGAVDAGAIPPCDIERNAYVIVTLKTAYLHSCILGNELGVSLPTPVDVARFCLRGLGAELPDHLA